MQGFAATNAMPSAKICTTNSNWPSMPSVDKSRLKRLCRPGLKNLRIHASCLPFITYYAWTIVDICANLEGIQGNLDQRIQALWLWDLKWARQSSAAPSSSRLSEGSPGYPLWEHGWDGRFRRWWNSCCQWTCGGFHKWGYPKMVGF